MRPATLDASPGHGTTQARAPFGPQGRLDMSVGQSWIVPMTVKSRPSDDELISYGRDLKRRQFVTDFGVLVRL